MLRPLLSWPFTDDPPSEARGGAALSGPSGLTGGDLAYPRRALLTVVKGQGVRGLALWANPPRTPPPHSPPFAPSPAPRPPPRARHVAARGPGRHALDAPAAGHPAPHRHHPRRGRGRRRDWRSRGERSRAAEETSTLRHYLRSIDSAAHGHSDERTMRSLQRTNSREPHRAPRRRSRAHPTRARAGRGPSALRRRKPERQTWHRGACESLRMVG